MRLAFILALLVAVPAWSQSAPRSDDRAPRSKQESSSKDTLIDLSPPANDTQHPGSELDEEAEADRTGVRETKPWNPHKAMKMIEVGDFYFRDKNYKAATSRYREALEYKPNDSEATYKLAQSLEKSGELEEALIFYRTYLKSKPNGEFASVVKKAVTRLQPHVDIRKLNGSEDPRLLALRSAAHDVEVAEAYLKELNYEAATSRLRDALKTEPENARIYYLLGHSTEGLGKLNEALGNYYEYLTREPGGPHSVEAAKAIERLKMKGAVLTSQSSQNRR